MREPGFETLCAHAGDDPRRHLGAAAPPLYKSSTFTSPDAETFVRRGELRPDIYDYTRVHNPTTDILEAKLAALERAEAARCFSSGMGAVSACVLNNARSGEHVVAIDTLYGPTRALLSEYVKHNGIDVTFVPGTDPQQFVDALRPETRLIVLESPSTFVYRLQDLRAVARLARERGITTMVDNSWATPYFQNPIDLGIDLVVHSASKYLGGHSDLIGGVLAGSRERVDAVKSREAMLLGAVIDPFAAWLMLRGIRTLPLRMDRHQANALAVAEHLEQHPRVARVHYPGLESHPQRQLVCSQMRGCSGLLSMELKDGGRPASFTFINALRYFGIAVSWGGFESLALPGAFPQDGPEGGVRWGARIHVGLETAADLLNDLDQALAKL